ncbi:unnamed protein product [Urochloa humidicola]
MNQEIWKARKRIWLGHRTVRIYSKRGGRAAPASPDVSGSASTGGGTRAPSSQKGAIVLLAGTCFINISAMATTTPPSSTSLPLIASMPSDGIGSHLVGRRITVAVL